MDNQMVNRLKLITPCCLTLCGLLVCSCGMLATDLAAKKSAKTEANVTIIGDEEGRSLRITKTTFSREITAALTLLKEEELENLLSAAALTLKYSDDAELLPAVITLGEDDSQAFSLEKDLVLNIPTSELSQPLTLTTAEPVLEIVVPEPDGFHLHPLVPSLKFEKNAFRLIALAFVLDREGTSVGLSFRALLYHDSKQGKLVVTIAPNMLATPVFGGGYRIVVLVFSLPPGATASIDGVDLGSITSDRGGIRRTRTIDLPTNDRATTSHE